MSISRLLLQAAAGNAGAYRIPNSLRFRSSASAYLSRTPASAGSGQIFTVAFWVKRGTLSASGQNTMFFTQSVGGVATEFLFNQDNLRVYYYNGGYVYHKITTQVFRDPSAWYHIVWSVDTTQATASNRVRLYVNGVQITSFSTSVDPSQNVTTDWNSTKAVYAGGYPSATTAFDGYMADIYNIDGQALTPSSFGAFDATTGVWQPTKYSGSYGTNGFYLKFTDTTSTTALGYDSSGNGNNWTPNNLSLTTGSTYDSMLDSPTNYDNGGNGVGNYAVLNPVNNSGTLSNANLTFTQASAAYVSVAGSIGISSGKWAWEIYISSGGSVCLIGICSNAGSRPIDYTATNGWVYQHNGQTYLAGSGPNAYGASYTTGDTLRFELDADSGSLVVFKNNVSQGVMVSGLAAGSYSPLVILYGNGGTRSVDANFGQRPFTNSPTTGYKALNTQNLPAPTIQNGSNFMAATLYTGNGTSQSIVNTVNGVSFQPDFVWIKRRNLTANHQLYDSIRGVQKALYSDLTSQELTQTGGITAFLSNGITVGSDAGVNGSGDTQVAWNWKAGGTAVTNTAGSITSSVSANTTAGFSVVTYTGAISGTVGHGLGVAPSLIICKSRTAAVNWPVYHVSLGKDYALLLSTTDAAGMYSNYWGTSSPNALVFGLWSSLGNNNNGSMVAYCFAAIAGYSAFGSYTGNGSTDGPFVFLGFRPRWIMIKRTDAAHNWCIWDTSRDTFNVVTQGLFANTSDANIAGVYADIVSNGFKLRDLENMVNASGGTYIYAAFCEVPMKFALAR